MSVTTGTRAAAATDRHGQRGTGCLRREFLLAGLYPRIPEMSEYADRYNTHWPHQRERIGGLFHEYGQVA